MLVMSHRSILFSREFILSLSRLSMHEYRRKKYATVLSNARLEATQDGVQSHENDGFDGGRKGKRERNFRAGYICESSGETSVVE